MKVCGLDVHKDSIFCAIYDGKKYSEVKEFSTMVPSICSMGSYLLSEKVEKGDCETVLKSVSCAAAAFSKLQSKASKCGSCVFCNNH